MQEADVDVKVTTISAGKFRRYHGRTWAERLLDLETLVKNLHDLIFIVIGFMQSLWLLAKVRPDAVFTKGGFVCVPIGLAARLLRIPLVIHDSDTIPGLTNRILARHATTIATGAPLDNYKYPAAKSHYTGTPIRAAYRPADAKERRGLKQALGYDPDLPLVLVTGGGLGSAFLNTVVTEGAARVTERAQLVHLTGVGKTGEAEKAARSLPHYHVLDFVDRTMPDLIRAADVIVTRAGATALLEVAAAGAAVIIVPNPLLTGGHQTKNAAVYTKADAALVVDEARLKQEPEVLAATIVALLHDAPRRKELSANILGLARLDAARELARLISAAARRRPA